MYDQANSLEFVLQRDRENETERRRVQPVKTTRITLLDNHEQGHSTEPTMSTPALTLKHQSVKAMRITLLDDHEQRYCTNHHNEYTGFDF
mmetsp:Transcript_17844/g.49877  ORF Transcript_17844/g.49877 Transcript_17844/m.49877 type:complete len:90 (-) Transcript_17844:3021-3290(-)